MVLKAEQQRVRALLAEAVTVLCKNGLTFSSELCVEGLIGITLDKDDVFLVNIKETFNSINNKSYDQDSDDNYSSRKKPLLQPKVEPQSSKPVHSSRQSYFARQHVARARKRATTTKFPNLITTSTPVHSRVPGDSNALDNITTTFSEVNQNDSIDEDRKPQVEHLIKAEPQDEDDDDDVMFVKEEASQRTMRMPYQGQQHQMSFHDQSSSIASDQPPNNSIEYSQYSASEGDAHHTLQDSSQMADYSNLPGCSNWDLSGTEQQHVTGPLPMGQQHSPGMGGELRQHQPGMFITDDGRWICRTCHMSFGYQVSCRRHIMEMHKHHLRCRVCGRLFTSNQFRLQHMIANHVKTPCRLCDKQYYTKWEIREHMKSKHKVLLETGNNFSSNADNYKTP